VVDTRPWSGGRPAVFGTDSRKPLVGSPRRHGLLGRTEGTDAGVRFPASSPGLRRPDTARSSRPEEFPGQVARIGDANPESIAETGRELFDDSSGEEVRVPVGQGVHR
jgi:hypothetical protein